METPASGDEDLRNIVAVYALLHTANGRQPTLAAAAATAFAAAVAAFLQTWQTVIQQALPLLPA